MQFIDISKAEDTLKALGVFFCKKVSKKFGGYILIAILYSQQKQTTQAVTK